MRFEPGEQVGQYRVDSVLATGGMSESYRGTDAASGQAVVLKVPLGSMMGDLATYGRYEREVAIGGKLHHPNIQQLLASGMVPGTSSPYIVMEYVEGEPFNAYLKEHGPLPIAEATELALQIADALHYCHEVGVIHRDLKPDNLLMTDGHQLKLLDFGIAFMEGARRLTWGRLSEAFGTPDYMAPEQIQGHRGDARTDVYALGTMLFEMLAGRVPYPGDEALAIMAAHVSTEAPRVRSLRREVSPELDAIVAKAIRREPAERYASMAELEADLRHPEAIDLVQFAWQETDKAHSWAGWDHSVGAMPTLKRAIALIAITFGTLGLIGFLAQHAHHAAR
ncbi:MAG: serine/threonine protein kinase [Chloroflexi bacterium]|nr:serine/threonine protein kinase [Chloroflexota bacterium]